MMAKSENSKQKYIQEIGSKSVEKVKANSAEKMAKKPVELNNKGPCNVSKEKVEDKNNAMGSGCSPKKKSSSKRHTIEERNPMEWRIGDYCRAAYEGDSLLYEAKIVGVIDDCFIIEFLGYGNQQRVHFNFLAESFGKRARDRQRRIAAECWSVGNFCRAIYREDDLLYEAVIEDEIDEERCLVRFIGYEDTEVVPLEDLYPSEGPEAQDIQQKNASEKWMHYRDPQHAKKDEDSSLSSNCSLMSDTSSSQSESRMSYTKVKMPTRSHPCSDHNEQASHASARCGSTTNIPLPPAPFSFETDVVPSESSALSSLLMSWYLAGYHTGYFEGARSKNSKC